MIVLGSTLKTSSGILRGLLCQWSRQSRYFPSKTVLRSPSKPLGVSPMVLSLSPQWIVGKIWSCVEKRNQANQSVRWCFAQGSNCCDDYSQSKAASNEISVSTLDYLGYRGYLLTTKNLRSLFWQDQCPSPLTMTPYTAGARTYMRGDNGSRFVHN